MMRAASTDMSGLGIFSWINDIPIYIGAFQNTRTGTSSSRL